MTEQPANDIIVRRARADDFSASLTRTLRARCAVCGELAIKVPYKYPDKVASQSPLNSDRVWFQFH